MDLIKTALGNITVSETGTGVAGKPVYAALSIAYARAGHFEKPVFVE